MDFKIEDLKERVEKYFFGNLSKEELGKWANELYYDLLRGEYLEVKKIVAYPFLRKLSTIHIKEDETKDIFPCSINEVKIIKDILEGKKNQTYSVEIGIPWTIKGIALDVEKKEKYEELINVLSKYSNRDIMDDMDLKVCSNVLETIDDKEGTLQYILESHIKSFLENNIDWEEKSLDLNHNLGLYSKKAKKEDKIINKIKDYVSCYIGEKNLGVDIIFISGIPQIILNI